MTQTVSCIVVDSTFNYIAVMNQVFQPVQFSC